MWVEGEVWGEGRKDCGFGLGGVHRGDWGWGSPEGRGKGIEGKGGWRGGIVVAGYLEEIGAHGNKSNVIGRGSSSFVYFICWYFFSSNPTPSPPSHSLPQFSCFKPAEI